MWTLLVGIQFNVNIWFQLFDVLGLFQGMPFGTSFFMFWDFKYSYMYDFLIFNNDVGCWSNNAQHIRARINNFNPK